MFTGKCNIDNNLNDVAIYCWYRGCWPEQFGHRLARRWLYILRSMNDAAIVWHEGVPTGHEDETTVQRWIMLAEESGKAAVDIFQDATGFVYIP